MEYHADAHMPEEIVLMARLRPVLPSLPYKESEFLIKQVSLPPAIPTIDF